MPQIKLPTPEPIDHGEHLKQQSIDTAEQHANEEWKEVAYSALVICADTMPRFTADDVWKLIRMSDAKTHDNRAYGAVVRLAAKNGLIKPTMHFVPSNRPQVHKNPIRVWESNIFNLSKEGNI